MISKNFSISSVLKEGWELTKLNMGFLVSYQLILWILSFLIEMSPNNWLGVLLGVAGWIIITLAHMGFFKSALLLTLGSKPQFDQLYKNWPFLLSWIIANILVGLAFFAGLLLLIVPGLYVLARLGLFPYFLLDKNLGPLETIKKTWEASEGITWPLFLLFLACIGVNILGLLFFGVGLFLTVPITLIALATVYRKITGQSKTSIQPKDIEIS